MCHTKIGHTLLTWDVFAHPENIEQGIRDIAALGFAGTETGGGLYDWWEQHRPGQLKQILEDAGIPMVTLFHSGDWTEAAEGGRLLEDARRWSTAIADLGGEMLMLVPGRRRDIPPYGLDDFKRMAEAMNRAGQIAHGAGIAASMHPHWGTAAETRLEIELLLSLLDPALVGFAPDTGQIAKGGADPLPVIERWADRISYMHLKDLSSGWEAQRAAGVPLRSPEGYAEMGQGIIDFPRVLAVLDRADYGGWLMAELDEAKRPGKESAALAKRYIEQTLRLSLERSAPAPPHDSRT
jgi:inosose dehydratase